MIATIFITLALSVNALFGIMNIVEHYNEKGIWNRLSTMIDTISVVALGVWFYTL